ncbi:hypothetical protein PoB_001370400 [Plakobranchus ocellatus]|uniref:Uncharacterized protein n=1 Tax=Plakobranchus ocellatus TaxID=259542 RepID=A0AAV3YYK4_9GAST|nr:hypothetical protein PoB_001370400 [Plakobranchus ocellatus]
MWKSVGLLHKANSQQGDLSLLGLPSGPGADGRARTRDRRGPADLRADSQATVPPTPPECGRIWEGIDESKFMHQENTTEEDSEKDYGYWEWWKEKQTTPASYPMTDLSAPCCP